MENRHLSTQREPKIYVIVEIYVTIVCLYAVLV